VTRAEELAEKVRKGIGEGLPSQETAQTAYAALSELVRLAELGSAISEPGWISTPEKVLQLRADAEALAEALQEALDYIGVDPEHADLDPHTPTFVHRALAALARHRGEK
jgi:hypothetical protein